MLNCQVLIKKLLQIKQDTCWKWVEKAKNIWFKLFHSTMKAPWKHHLHFHEDGAQHYLVFQPRLKYFTLNSNGLQNGSRKDYLTKVLKLLLK